MATSGVSLLASTIFLKVTNLPPQTDSVIITYEDRLDKARRHTDFLKAAPREGNVLFEQLTSEEPSFPIFKGVTLKILNKSDIQNQAAQTSFDYTYDDISKVGLSILTFPLSSDQENAVEGEVGVTTIRFEKKYSEMPSINPFLYITTNLESDERRIKAVSKDFNF